MWLFLTLVIVSALGQSTIDSITSTTQLTKKTITTTSHSSTVTQPTSASLTTNSHKSSTIKPRSFRLCGNVGETDVCHFEDNPKETCDVCEGVVCSHGRKCSKKKGQCDHECICQNLGEVPDENGICRVACRNNPCRNNGTCQVEGAKQTCLCSAGYEGDACENGILNQNCEFLLVRNVCLDPQPAKCPTGAYECDMKGVNNYSCNCAAGYFANKDNHCVRVGHMVKLEIHFVETPYSEVYNDPSKPEYKNAREMIRYPFEKMYEERLVAVEFRNFTQGSLVANLEIFLKSAENGSHSQDEYTFMEHLLQCSLKESSTTPECFGKLGRVFLPRNAWQLEDERCDNVLCPRGTICQPIQGEAEKTRCICDTGYQGYGSLLDTFGTVIELCKDFDECATIPSICSPDESCVNMPGSFECTTPCRDVICPGYGNCVVIDNGKYQCECSWIYAGSACSFPWTLIFLITSALLLLATIAAGYLLWRKTSSDRKGKSRPFAS